LAAWQRIAGAEYARTPGSSKNGSMASKPRLRPATHQTPPLAAPTDRRNSAAGMSLGAKWAVGGIIAGSAVAGLLGAGSSALALYFARRVITPAQVRDENQEVLAVIRDGGGLQIILAATADSTVEGVYGLFFDGGRGHARIGRILSYSPSERTVLREVEAVYSGDLSTARRGWWSGAAYPDPAATGLPAEDVLIDVDGGTAPAWLVRAEPAPDIWAIMVHGRGASRQECLRAVRPARELGLTSLLISYRNDGLAPSAQDGRYGLGSTEWRDVEAAISFALANGAKEVVLFGWSMGGAICLQTADLSRYHHLIRALVLDAPVVDWVNVLAHHAQLNRIPSAVGRYGQLMMSHPLGRRLTGLAAPVDLKSMDWVARAVELRTPTLILHSVDDEYVPYGPSASIAEKNPEMVTFETFRKALHTKEWNVDPERWEGLVTAWLRRQLAPRPNPGLRSDPGLRPESGSNNGTGP
jgi:pimeloyl-ACP methyl ester carboxylesterase